MLEKIMILHEMKLMGIDISVQLKKDVFKVWQRRISARCKSKRLWIYSSIIAFFPHLVGSLPGSTPGCGFIPVGI